MGDEKKFSRALCPKLRELGWWVQPIESGETGLGIPDLYMAKNHVALWMELKAVHVNWPTIMRLPFRPGQYAWLHGNAKHGGVSVVGVKFANGYVFCNGYDIDTPNYAIKKEGRSLLYLPRLYIDAIDGWLLSQRNIP
jgi:hypothetical protein